MYWLIERFAAAVRRKRRPLPSVLTPFVWRADGGAGVVGLELSQLVVGMDPRQARIMAKHLLRCADVADCRTQKVGEN